MNYKLETPWQTPGQTPGNGDRGVPRENNAEARIAPQNVPGAFPAPPVQRIDPFDWHKQELLNGVADTRTKLLDSYFFLIYISILLHFLTYI